MAVEQIAKQAALLLTARLFFAAALLGAARLLFRTARLFGCAARLLFALRRFAANLLSTARLLLCTAALLFATSLLAATLLAAAAMTKGVGLRFHGNHERSHGSESQRQTNDILHQRYLQNIGQKWNGQPEYPRKVVIDEPCKRPS